MSVYTVKTFEHGWRVTKFDSDLNVESSYTMLDEPKGIACDCPQAARGHCRHIDILGTFQAFDRVNTGWFLNFDSGEWSPPLQIVAIDPPDAVPVVRVPMPPPISNTGEPPPSPVPDGSRKRPPLTSPSGFVFDGVEGIRRV